MAYDPARRLREPRLLTPAETANILSVSLSTLARWRKGNEGPRWVMVGTRPRYTPAEINRYLAEQTVSK